MRITMVSYLPLIGLLFIFSACSSPATRSATPTPAVITPVTPAPVAITPAAPAPVPGQAAFIVSELTINPEVVVLGGNVIVSVNVSNTGKERGTYTVVVKFNGKTAKTQDVTLDGGASEKVELSLVPEFPWEYQVTVAQLTGRLDVITQGR